MEKVHHPIPIRLEKELKKLGNHFMVMIHNEEGDVFLLGNIDIAAYQICLHNAICEHPELLSAIKEVVHNVEIINAYDQGNITES